MFDVLVHTDCTSQESTSGRSGFGFQATSSGATAEDEARITGGLLHVVPSASRPEHPDEHPPTCVWAVHGGRYYLARGRSTGRTISGRPGNQLTQTIVTSSSADILPLRPAQLFSSPAWTLDRAPARDADPWPTPLEIDAAFEIPALHAMVLDDPWARDVLPTFLTMVERATATPRTRLVLVHTDQDVVMRWIALASLFEDPERSLAMTFKVFTSNPLSTDVAIAGAHPALSPDLTAGGVEGCSVVDLSRRTTSRVETSASAALHAAWFLREDPYEGLEAVETSRRWSAVAAHGVAARSAAVACLGDRPDEEGSSAALTMLSALARAGAHDDLEALGDALVDAVVTRPAPPGGDVVPVSTALWDLSDHGEPDLACALATTALQWAAGDAALAATWSAHGLGLGTGARRCLSWSDAEDAARAADTLADVLEACSADDLPGWFRLAEVLGTGLPADRRDRSVQRLARSWAADPALGASSRSWWRSEQVVAALEGELVRRLRAGDATTAAAVAQGTWDSLTGPDLLVDLVARPLSAWLAASTLAGRSAAERARIIRQAAPGVGGADAALFLGGRPAPAGPEEVAAWIACHPQMSTEVATFAEVAVDVALRDRQPEQLGVLVRALRAPGVRGRTAPLDDAVAHLSTLEKALSPAGGARAARRPGLGRITGLPPAWVALRADGVAELVLRSDDAGSLRALAQRSGAVLDVAVRAAVRRWVEAGTADALAAPLYLMEVDPDGFGQPARSALITLSEEPGWGPRLEVLRDGLPPDRQPGLEEFLVSLPRGRRLRGVLRGARRVIDGRDR